MQEGAHMKTRSYLLAAIGSALVLCACASNPQSDDSVNSAYAAATSKDPAVRQAASTQAANAQAASGKKKPVWTVPTEDEVAKELDLKYRDAARDFVTLKKDGEYRFCKRYREIGSSIARINCLTEGELRTQVDDMTQYRDNMRNRSGKCTTNVGCGAGF
jgi:hypothetical protein